MSDKNWPESLGRTRMGVCIGAFDWSTTSLGPLANWPDGLRAALQLSLNSRFPMHIWWGPDLINLYNDASIPVLGKRHPAALGRPAQTVWAEAWSHLQPQVEGVLKRAESTWNDHLHLMLARNGFPEEAWFTWSHSPIRDDSGSVRGLHGVMIENTPRVLAEQSLERLSDERLRQAADERARIILESITEAFFALDRNWKFTYVNPQSLVLLGRPPQDLIGKSLWDEYPGLRGSPFEPVYRNVAATRVAESIIDYFPDHQRWYEVRAYPAHDGGLSIYFRDVSEQKQVEFDLADATRRLEAAIQGGGMSTWVWDIPANRIFADRSMSDFFQVPADQNAGLPLEVYAKMIHPEDRPRVLALLEAVAAGNGQITVETRNVELSEPSQDRNVRLTPGCYVCVEVSDNGSGIAPDALPRVFEPFFTTKKAPHRGLGMALAYGIVTNHGGGVAVSSEPGKGASVRIYLPAEKEIVQESGGAGENFQGTETILVVDDEEMLLSMTETILNDYGYKTMTANSGTKALAVLSRDDVKVDMVITDLVMPGMGGRELVERIRQLAPDVKILCTSGYVMPADKKKGPAYLQKPFTSDNLLAKVKRVLSRTTVVD